MTTAGPLRHRAFRLLLAGSTVNSLGNAVAPVALAFAVLDLGGSLADLGLVLAANALADIAAVMGGGVLGDRLPRTAMMRVSNVLAGVVQSALAITMLTGQASIGLLAVGSGAIGAFGSLARPSSQALTQQTIPPDALRSAITMRRLSQNAAQIVGSGAAGVLVVWVGPGGALAVDAATFLVAAACFGLIRVPAIARTDTEAATRFLADAASGLREVWRHSWLWSLIAMALVYHLFYGGAQGVLGPAVVGGRLGPAAWGYALSAMMVGFVLGGLVSLVWRPRRMLLAGELALLLTVCFPLAMALSDRLWPVLVGAAVHGVGLEIFSVGWDLAIQENVPPHMLARVYSFDQLGSFMARPVGLALTGPLAALTGDRIWLLVVAGAILVAEIVPLALTDVRRLTRASAATEQAPVLQDSAP